MYPRREVFVASPLALVAAEIRFSDAARLRQQQTRDEVILALEDRFPYADPLQQAAFNLTAPTPQFEERTGVILKDVANTETVTIMSDSLIYETTDYADFDNLTSAITRACDALAAANVSPALRRIGLRYIDEIRVPGDPIVNVREWGKWIDGVVLASLDAGPEVATSLQTVNTYDLGGGKGLNARFAALNQGPIVASPHLRRPVFEPGPFFVLDFDGYHDFTGEENVPLTSEVVVKSLTDVHSPCGTAFQRSITDEARALFRGTSHE